MIGAEGGIWQSLLRQICVNPQWRWVYRLVPVSEHQKNVPVNVPTLRTAGYHKRGGEARPVHSVERLLLCISQIALYISKWRG